MKAIHLTLTDSLRTETEAQCLAENCSLSEYVERALVAYNAVQKRDLLAMRMRRASKLVRKSSMDVLRELEALPDAEGLD